MRVIAVMFNLSDSKQLPTARPTLRPTATKPTGSKARHIRHLKADKASCAHAYATGFFSHVNINIDVGSVGSVGKIYNTMKYI